jgi:hypothetical protein
MKPVTSDAAMTTARMIAGSQLIQRLRLRSGVIEVTSPP